MRIKWQDALVAGALVAVGIGGTRFAARAQYLPIPGPLGWALIVVAALALLARTARPLWSLVIAVGAIAVYLGLGYPFGPILLSGSAAVYAVALRMSVRTTLISCFLYLAATLPQWTDNLLGWVTWSLGWIFLPAVAGFLVGQRRRSLVDQREHAVTEERLRLAQEVHDVVGHGLAVIAMQAGVALHVLDRDPVKARASLEAIRDTSREALEDLRGELETMRGDAPLRPSTSDIGSLVSRMRSAGLSVSLMVEVDELPSDVETAVYRIVQESLTNVLRHAGPGVSASVDLSCSDGSLVVSVVDTGTGGAFAEGSGITGMRRRAEALGGSLEAGPSDSGGFAVRARIPLPS